MKITINEETIELKYGFRALMIYEDITGKSFQAEGLTSIITFFYSIVLASSKDKSVKFEQFVDWLDENSNELRNFTDWLSQTVGVQNEVSSKDEKKTVKRRKK